MPAPRILPALRDAALNIDPGQWQHALQDGPEADQHHQQFEQLREPAVGGKAVDRPKADRSNHNDDEDADQSGNHLCFPLFRLLSPGPDDVLRIFRELAGARKRKPRHDGRGLLISGH
jgi:hypothetical protein